MAVVPGLRPAVVEVNGDRSGRWFLTPRAVRRSEAHQPAVLSNEPTAGSGVWPGWSAVVLSVQSLWKLRWSPWLTRSRFSGRCSHLVCVLRQNCPVFVSLKGLRWSENSTNKNLTSDNKWVHFCPFWTRTLAPRLVFSDNFKPLDCLFFALSS